MTTEAQTIRNNGVSVAAAISWVAFLIVMAIVLIAGYQLFHTNPPFKAGDDIGYNLGLVGGVMMLFLLFYPLRKRFRFMKPLGSIPNWFKLHMIFGILGPVLVLFHTTFRLGAMNDRIALTCMILVAGSGVFGRFFYSRIHHGLYGREASLREVEAQMVQRGDMQSAFAFAPDIEQRLAAFRERFAPGQSRDSGRRFGDFFMVGIRGFGLRWSLRGRLKQALRAERERGRLQTQQVKSVYSNGQGLIASHIRSVRDVSRFHIYQRLFSWWHILHIPLVYLLVFSAIFHVISVHMY